MIINDNQYKMAKEKLQMLTQTLLTQEENVPMVLITASRSQIQQLIAEIEADINQYLDMEGDK